MKPQFTIDVGYVNKEYKEMLFCTLTKDSDGIVEEPLNNFFQTISLNKDPYNIPEANSFVNLLIDLTIVKQSVKWNQLLLYVNSGITLIATIARDVLQRQSTNNVKLNSYIKGSTSDDAKVELKSRLKKHLLKLEQMRMFPKDQKHKEDYQKELYG